MEELIVVGKSLPRIDGLSKAMGEAKFASDLFFPHMLHGKVLRSPLPHARILNIDAARAKRLTGVKAVITGSDTYGLSYTVLQELNDPTLFDKQPLCVEKVRYVGDEVAAVAAVDKDTAEEALQLIRVDYEPLPAAFDPAEAMKPEAPLIHGKKQNVAWEIHLNVGDVEAGFAQADHIREDTFHTSPIAHCPLEPHTCVAEFDSTGRLSIWSATQTPYRIRMNLARLLKIPESKVRVVLPHVGGGFGSRAELMPHEFCAALLSKHTGRPVKIALTRDEVFNCTRTRHPMILTLKTGVKKDGTLVARQSRVIVDNGAYNSTGPIAVYLCVAFMHGVFYIPNLKCDALLVYTNNPINGPKRGHGGVQGRFAADSQLDMIARDLGMDTAELMLKNGVEPGDTLAHGLRVTSCGLKESIKAATQSAGWGARRSQAKEGTEKKKGDKPSEIRRGLGIGCHAYLSGVNQDPYVCHSAIVKIHEDGGISLLTGAADIGQGSNTVLAQIVAEEFGVALDDVRVVVQDTEVTPLDRGSFSSRVTLWTGNAVKAAAADAKQQLFRVISEKLEANPKDLVIKNRRVYVVGTPERGMPIDEAIKYCQLATEGRPIIGRGYYSMPFALPNLKTAIGNLSGAYSYGATVAEVEVDCRTGKVKVLNLTVAHDCGRAVNPLSVEGQLDGCAIMGVGTALSERLVLEEGRSLNPSVLDYKVPLIEDIPAIKNIIIETIDPEGPFGAKEAGEGSIISVAPAIANAIYDAVGVRITGLPITPEKVLRALMAERKESL